MTAPNPKPSRVIIFRLDVRVTVPLSEDHYDPDYPTLDGATSSDYKRNYIEKPMIACLRKFEWPTEIELCDFSVEDE